MKEIYPERTEGIEYLDGVETTKTAFRNELGKFAQYLPEANQNFDALTETGNEIIETIGMSEWFCTGTVNGLLFTAISAHQLELERRAGSDEEYAKGTQFTIDVARMLAWDKAEGWEGLKTPLENIDGAAIYEAHKAFLHPQATTALEKAIEQRGLLDAIRDYMGITPDTEQPFVPMVLDIEFSSRAPEVAAKTRAFYEAVGRSREAGAWMEKFEGTPHIVFPLNTADGILAFSSHKDQETLPHEYVHSQPALFTDGTFGKGFEEMRAEVIRTLAHNDPWKMIGYKDYFNLYQDMEIITGVDILTLIGDTGRQKDIGRLYLELSEKLGLAGMLEASLILDSHYSQGINSIEKRIADYVGKPDDLAQRIYHKTIQNPSKKLALEARLAKILEDREFKREMPIPVSKAAKTRFPAMRGITRQESQPRFFPLPRDTHRFIYDLLAKYECDGEVI